MKIQNRKKGKISNLPRMFIILRLIYSRLALLMALVLTVLVSGIMVGLYFLLGSSPDEFEQLQ